MSENGRGLTVELRWDAVVRPLSVLIAGGILCGIYTDLAHAGSLYIYEMALPKTQFLSPINPWRKVDEVEFATLEWVDWFNQRRLLEPIGNVPPAEFEAMYEQQEGACATGATPN